MPESEYREAISNSNLKPVSLIVLLRLFSIHSHAFYPFITAMGISLVLIITRSACCAITSSMSL